MFEHEEQQQQAEAAALKIQEAYERLFMGYDASLVLMDLMEYAPVFRPSANDAEDGMRRVVLRILRLSGAEARMKQALGAL